MTLYRQIKNHTLGQALRFTSFLLLSTLSFLSFGQTLTNQPDFQLQAFSAEYEARYRGFNAKASRSLIQREGQVFEMNSIVELKVLGRTIASINESSLFEADGNLLRTQHYGFEQKGMGSRRRSLDFDWSSNSVMAANDDESWEIFLEEPVFDELNANLYLSRQVAAGEQDIHFQVLDKGELKDIHYQVVGHENIETSMGAFNAARVERVRDPGSNRSTTVWLASDWGHMLIKLEQIDPKDRKLELSLSAATFDGANMTALVAR